MMETIDTIQVIDAAVDTFQVMEPVIDTFQVMDPAEVECLLTMVANVVARLVQDDARELTGGLDDVDA